jgi:hypothetical protein
MTETRGALKTTEFYAYLAMLAGILIAGAVVDQTDAGGYGARQVWLYATILTIGYMVSRGLAKAGNAEPWGAERDDVPDLDDLPGREPRHERDRDRERA